MKRKNLSMHIYYYSLHIAGCYIHDVSAVVLPGFLQVPFVIFVNLSGISNLTLYLNRREVDCSHSAV